MERWLEMLTESTRLEYDRILKRQKEDGGTSFAFTCAQSCSREHKPKVPKTDRARDTQRMDRFACNGWLYISATKSSPVMSISIRHDLPHVAYHSNELPERWKKYIEENALSRTAGDVSCYFF